MKKTVFFVSSLGDGGAQRVISILSKKMAMRNMEVEIVTYYDIPMVYDICTKVKVTCVEKCTGKKDVFHNLLWLRRYFKENAKIVLSFLAPFNMIALVAVMGTKVPIIVADRNDPAKVPGNFVVRLARDLLYGLADQVVVQTEANKAYFKQLQNKTRVIYNPVDLKEYTGIALNSKKEKLIVTAGRLLPQKNQKMLINAFGKVSEKFPEYKMVIYGEGSYRNELENYVSEIGLKDKVLMPGSVKDLYDRIKAAEIFVLSSDYEGMPNALIEAMCLGLPCISTKVSGATDLILNGENGILVNVGSEEELAEAMKKMISDGNIRNRMAEKAVELTQRLLPDEILEQWLDIVRRYSC